MSKKPFGQDDLFDEWSRKLHDIMDQMLEREFVQFRQFRDTGAWQPALNIYETRDNYHICVELAGIDETQISVELRHPSTLIIAGQRDQPCPAGVEGPLSVYALEVDEGAFTREIELPENIAVDHIEATYQTGFLWITVPRNAHARRSEA